MQLTARDLDILRFINDFGFCEMPHINQRFGLKHPRNYQIMGRLIHSELVKCDAIFYRRHRMFRLTGKGAKYTDLPALHRVALGNFKHNLSLIEVYLKLRALYSEATWISERALKHDKYFKGVGQHGHVSDGILLLNDRQVAIEVELTSKGKNRWEKILNAYSAELSINEVWYYATQAVSQSLCALASKMPFIKVFDLNEFLR
jgi:predicted transcriptional regulator